MRAAVLRALAEDLIHERRMKRTRADGIARRMPCLYPGPASSAPVLDADEELLVEVIASADAEPGRTRRALAEALRHDRRRGERAVDRAISEGHLHTREVVKRWPSGARIVVGVFAGAATRPQRAIAGEKVSRARATLLLGQAQLAGRLGVSPSMLRKWERAEVPPAWAAHVDAVIYPGEGAEVRIAEAKKRVKAARATVARKILAAVREQPGVPRWGPLARVLSAGERAQLQPTIDHLIAIGEIHERPFDNGHGSGLFTGPAPAEYAAAGDLGAHELRILFARTGLRQRDVAGRIGAGVATVNAWAQGRRPIPLHRQVQLREQFAEGRPALEISGEQLRTERHRLGWTQAELAERAGVSQAVVSRWERESPPRRRIENLRALLADAEGSQGQLFSRSTR